MRSPLTRTISLSAATGAAFVLGIGLLPVQAGTTLPLPLFAITAQVEEEEPLNADDLPPEDDRPAVDAEPLPPEKPAAPAEAPSEEPAAPKANDEDAPPAANDTDKPDDGEQPANADAADDDKPESKDDPAEEEVKPVAPAVGPRTGYPSRSPYPSRSSDTPRSFNSPRTSAPATPAEPASPPYVRTGPSPDGKLLFNFRYAPWKDVLEWFADQADLSLVYEVLPAGTFNYTDKRSYTPAEAIDLINSVLLTKGYTLVRHERMLMVINLEDGINPNLITQVKASELDDRGSYELVSVLFRVTRIKPEEMELEIAKLLGPQGTVKVLPQAKQIFVTETAGRLRTIRDVIEAIENPAAASDKEVEVLTLQHVTPDEALAVARPLLGLPEGQNVAPDESLRISLDPLGGRLLVTGSDEQTAKLKQILELVDVSSGAAGAAAIETPQLEVYPVGSSDPAVVLRVMQTLLAGEPDVRLETDQTTGNLVALCRPSHHATIRATLEQMSRDGRDIEVIQLSVVDPQVAMLSINKLFGGGTENPSASAPKIEADPITGQLIIRGSQAQIEQIRGMLQKMGESGESPSLYASGGPRSNLRTINLSGYGARTALEQVQALWPTMGLNQNRIRVVTPSAPIAEKRPNAPAEEDGPRRVDSNDPFLDWLQNFPGGSGLRPAEGNSRPASPENRVPVPPADVPPPAEPEPQPLDDQQTQAVPGERRIAASFALAMFQPAGNAPAAPPPVAPEEPESIPGAEIIVAPGPGGLVIASDDLDALDQFEYLLQTIVDQLAASGNQYTVFYLKYAEAPAAASLLQEVLGTGGTDSGGGGGGGGLLGGLASAALGGGGDLFGDLLGLGGGGSSGGLLSSSPSLSIVADTRLNALVVQGSPADVDMIEQMLKIIDQENSPEDVETIAKPRLIPVFNTNANDIANVVKEVYSQRIASAGGNNQRQPSPEDFVRALRGGGGGNNRGGRNEAEQQKMTIGVDSRSNSLVVAAPDPLFDQVKALVEQLDQAVEETNQTVQVVQLRRSTPQVMQKALNSVLGTQAQSSTTSGSNNSNNNSSSSDSQRASEEFQNQLRQRAEFFNALQRSGGGGDSGGRGGPPSSRGGSFGGRGRGGR